MLWQRIRAGLARVVVGVRSAVFAPFPRIGLIVVDEEQEASYKQFEGLRYNARDVALARGKMEGFKVVLGSATPSIEVFHAAKEGRFHYLGLKKRVDDRPMPAVEIIDMTKAEKETPALSKRLVDEMRDNSMQGKQSLLLLNRRGYSPYYMCPDCGFTFKCPMCSITLIYHKDTNRLNCHYCGSWLDPGTQCPQCRGVEVKFLGTGTQRVEEELVSLFPELSFQRMDRDTTQRKHAHNKMISRMENREIDVLLGTQMVARGHDFPDVTLAAVISADVALNMPDFRSGERAFQLFTQLAGRAGRGQSHGRVLIQTFEPDNYIFNYIRTHDYVNFYEQEIINRKELSYPPYSRLVRIIFSCRRKGEGERLVSKIASGAGITGDSSVEVLGPCPAPIEKIKGLWRWHMLLKGGNARALRNAAFRLTVNLEGIKGLKVDIDIDPVNLL